MINFFQNVSFSGFIISTHSIFNLRLLFLIFIKVGATLIFKRRLGNPLLRNPPFRVFTIKPVGDPTFIMLPHKSFYINKLVKCAFVFYSQDYLNNIHVNSTSVYWMERIQTLCNTLHFYIHLLFWYFSLPFNFLS